MLKDAVQRKADILFDREYTLDLGGVQVRFLVVGPTHTKGDTGLFVEGDNVLFAGDVVMNTSFVAANAATSSMNAPTTPRGEPVYWIGAAGAAQDAGEGTDFNAVLRRAVSVTPLQMDLTRFSQLQAVTDWLVA